MENDDSEVIGFVNQGLVTEYVDPSAFLFDPKVSITSYGQPPAALIGKNPWELPPEVTDKRFAVIASGNTIPCDVVDFSKGGPRDAYGRLLCRQQWIEPAKPAENPMSTLDILAAELQMQRTDFAKMDDDATVTINKRMLSRIIWQAKKSALMSVGSDTGHYDYLLKVNPPIREQPKPQPEKSPKLHKLLFNPNDKV